MSHSGARGNAATDLSVMPAAREFSRLFSGTRRACAMTEGETRFYLREISSQWSTSNVSADKLAELEAARLIEINAVPFPTVRLTSEGTRRKNSGRPQPSAGGLPLS